MRPRAPRRDLGGGALLVLSGRLIMKLVNLKWAPAPDRSAPFMAAITNAQRRQKVQSPDHSPQSERPGLFRALLVAPYVLEFV
ncbi:MAG: hypothetical protein ACRDVP_05775 [Acidimicrobiales bacterium]